MAKNYIIQFGSSAISGLAPTFTTFKVVPGGGNTTPPGITEIPTSSGLYYFSYEPATSLAFIIDGATTGLPAVARYIAGALDPIQTIDERFTELGTSLAALGNTLVSIAPGGASVLAVLGTTASSFGSTSADPATVMGFLKRLQEFNEGMARFTKTSGVWDVYARGNAAGASTLLTEKTITDNGSIITKQ